MRVVISSGHGKYVRGASGYIDEVDEARLVVEEVAVVLREVGVETVMFHDNVSKSQSENLNRIVSFHNSNVRDFDISVHFNAYQTTSKPMGCEVLYVSSTGQTMARKIVDAICDAAGFINRGPKKRTDLAFLNGTNEPAVLIEVCFVDSKGDVSVYREKFDEICEAIAEAISDEEVVPEPEPVPEPPTGRDEIIKAMAANSAIANYRWKDRGIAPAGYIKGFALTWASIVDRFNLDMDPVVKEMAKANTHDDERDALSWYNSDFEKLGMSNESSGIDTLRHLFVLLMGAGMRESSGRHCEGRDQSASNVTSDTAEAGLYQTSYNAHSCSPRFDEIMAAYDDNELMGYQKEFAEGVACGASDWASYGSGRGREFQDLCKEEPAFALESAAIVMRNLRKHYGPINRKEVELRQEADWLLLNVQRYVMGEGVEV